MKLGFVSAIVADQDFEQTVDLAAELGYDSVEMLCWPKGKAERRYAGVTHIDVNGLGPSEIDRINGHLKAKGVSVSSLGYYPNALDGDTTAASAASDHIKKVISASRSLGIGVMTTFVGRDHTRDLEYNFARFREVFGDIVAHAEAEDVRIGIENCPMYFSSDEWPGGKNLAYAPAIWRRMFETIPSPYFGLNYDPSHMVWQQMDYLKPIAEFKDRIFHVHLKDAKVDRDRLNDVGILATPAEYHTPKLPGLGDVNWGRFFSVLTDIGYHDHVVVEVEDRAYEESLATRVQALRQSAAYLRQFVPTE